MLRKALARFIKWNPIAVVCVARQRIRRKLNAILHTFRLRFVYRAALWRSFGDSPPTTHRSAITLPIYRKLTDLISRRNKIDDQTTHLSIRTGDRRRSSFVVRRSTRLSVSLYDSPVSRNRRNKGGRSVGKYFAIFRGRTVDGDIAAIRRTVKTQLPAHPRASTPDRPRPYRAVKIDNARGKSPRS